MVDATVFFQRLLIFTYLTTGYVQHESALAIECEIPFQPINDNIDECYYISYPATVNGYIAAQESCEKMGATLAILNTEDKASNMSRYINRYVTDGYYYIGGYSVGHKDKYVWNGLGQQIRTNWWYDPPSTGEYCVALAAYWEGDWMSVQCDAISSFICQQVNYSCYDSYYETSCDDGYELVNGKCYSFVTQQTLSWIEAKEYCERRASVLAILDSEEDNQGVVSIIENNYNSNFWIGAYDQSHEGTWVWDGKGTEINYSDWYSGHPLYNNTLYNCAMIQLDGSEHNWFNARCKEKNNFTCQKLPQNCGVDIFPGICSRPTASTSQPTTESASSTTESVESTTHAKIHFNSTALLTRNTK